MTKETFLKNPPEQASLLQAIIEYAGKAFHFTNRLTGDMNQKERRVINLFEYIVSSLSVGFTLSRPSRWKFNGMSVNRKTSNLNFQLPF